MTPFRLWLSALLMGLVANVPGAIAQDYRAEVVEMVVERCYRVVARYRLVLARDEDPAIQLSESDVIAELYRGDDTERLIEAIAENVEGLPPQARKWAYDSAYVECFIGSAGGGMVE